MPAKQIPEQQTTEINKNNKSVLSFTISISSLAGDLTH
jgi:hypothetical protein